MPSPRALPPAATSSWAKGEDRDAWQKRAMKHKDMAALDPGRYDKPTNLADRTTFGSGYPGYSPHRRYDRLTESMQGPAWALHRAPKGVPPPGCYDLKSSFGKPPPLPVRSPRLANAIRGTGAAPKGLVALGLAR